MNEKSSEAIFTQVRIAHRLLAAYYQRLHHLIDEIHEDLGLSFWFWKPSRFARPTKKGNSPLKKHSWDLLMGVLTEYVFIHGKKGHNQLGDWVLRINVVSDTVIEQEASVKNPLEVNTPPEDGSSVLRFYIVAPRKDAKGNWYGRVQKRLRVKFKSDYENVKCMDENEEDSNVHAYAFEVPMEQLTAEGSADKLITKIKAASEAVLGDALREKTL